MQHCNGTYCTKTKEELSPFTSLYANKVHLYQTAGRTVKQHRQSL